MDLKNNSKDRPTKKCMVDGCKSNNLNSSLHSVPSNKDKAKQWLESIGVHEIPNTTFKYFCNNHFSNKNYWCANPTILKRRRLSDDALPCQSSSSLDLEADILNSQNEAPQLREIHKVNMFSLFQ